MQFIKVIIYFVIIFNFTYIKSNELKLIEEINLQDLIHNSNIDKKVIHFKVCKYSSTNETIDITKLLGKYLSENNYLYVISGSKEVTFSKFDFFHKDKSTCFLILDKTKSKFRSGDSLTIGYNKKNKDIDYNNLDNIFKTRIQTNISINFKESNNNLNPFFSNCSIIFIQDNNIDRWIQNPKTIKIYEMVTK